VSGPVNVALVHGAWADGSCWSGVIERLQAGGFQRLAASLAGHHVPHAAHVFAHGRHGLGLADGADDAAAWPTLAPAWIREQPT
jgi:hypothetical protein